LIIYTHEMVQITLIKKQRRNCAFLSDNKH